ncbi:MAG TPA: DegV family protein [Roseiflexaceae bacterium]|nr:DegV family protein [Roseiflexaceae bacterium]
MIKIVVDSTADVPPALAVTYNISVVPIVMQIGGTTFRDSVDLSRDDFYRRLVESDELPRTAAPAIGIFAERFQELAGDGSAVLSLSLSGELSSTYSAAQQAARMVENAEITCVDSHTTSMPMTFLAMAAADAARNGASLAEVVALVERLRERTALFFALDTLHYVEKGGRIGRARAWLGTMLSVKPILEISQNKLLPVEQVRTWKRVPTRLLELMQTRAPLTELAALYTTDRSRAEQLADMCAAAGLMDRARIHVVQVSAALGTHAGPNAVGLAGLGSAPPMNADTRR